MTSGIEYQSFTYHKARCHLIKIDTRLLQVRPVLAADAFPFGRIYPILDAVQQGCLAAVGGGFNLQWSHNQGVADQPLHALVVDGEIWTTGIGGGGYGLQIADNYAACLQNDIQVHLWRPSRQPLRVEHINFGHEGVVAFTARGGTNQRPSGRPYTTLLPVGLPRESFSTTEQDYTVAADSFEITGRVAVIETPWPLGLKFGDRVQWVQRLGTPGAVHVVSGWPGMIKDGVNVVPLLNLDPEAPNGPDNWFVRTNPRTALGTSEDGQTIFLCAVEGRLPNSERPDAEYSRGLRLKECATMLVNHGVYNAVNMDGGGATWMYKHPNGLIVPSCYDTPGTLTGLRPDHYVVAAFAR